MNRAESKKEIAREIEDRVSFPATLELKNVPISLTNPPEVW